MDVLEPLDFFVRDGQVDLGDRRVVDYPGMMTLASRSPLDK